MQEITWSKQAPPEIKVLAYVYANGGTVVHPPGVGAFISREIGMDSATQTNASKNLEREGVLYRHPRGNGNRFDRYALAGDWEQYEPAIKLWLGIEEDVAVADVVIAEDDDTPDTPGTPPASNNEKNLLGVYSRVVAQQREEILNLREVISTLLFANTGKLVDLVRNGVQDAEEN